MSHPPQKKEKNTRTPSPPLPNYFFTSYLPPQARIENGGIDHLKNHKTYSHSKKQPKIFILGKVIQILVIYDVINLSWAIVWCNAKCGKCKKSCRHPRHFPIKTAPFSQYNITSENEGNVLKYGNQMNTHEIKRNGCFLGKSLEFAKIQDGQLLNFRSKVQATSEETNFLIGIFRPT